MDFTNNPFRPYFKNGPLHGIVIIELARHVPAPFSTMLLSQMGALVIKVETGKHGDPNRLTEPFSPLTDSAFVFEAISMGKHSIALDLRSSQGMECLHWMLQYSDVLIESYRPGTLNAMGLDPNILTRKYPSLLIVSVSGFGQNVPSVGHDLNFQAASGILSTQIIPTHLPIFKSLYYHILSQSTPEMPNIFLNYFIQHIGKLGSLVPILRQHYNEAPQYTKNNNIYIKNKHNSNNINNNTTTSDATDSRDNKIDSTHISTSTSHNNTTNIRYTPPISRIEHSLIPWDIYSQGITHHFLQQQLYLPLHLHPNPLSVPSVGGIVSDITSSYVTVSRILAMIYDKQRQKYTNMINGLKETMPSSSPSSTSSLSPSTDPYTLPHPSALGLPSYLDISITDTATPINFLHLLGGDESGNGISPLTGIISGHFAPYTIYQTGNGYISLCALEPQFWKNVCTSLQLTTKYNIINIPYASNINKYELSNIISASEHNTIHLLSTKYQNIIKQLQYNHYVKECIQYELIQFTTEEWLDRWNKQGIRHELCIEPIRDPLSALYTMKSSLRYTGELYRDTFHVYHPIIPTEYQHNTIDGDEKHAIGKSSDDTLPPRLGQHNKQYLALYQASRESQPNAKL